MPVKSRDFKNALCLAQIPEGSWSGLSHRYRLCQREADHDGLHLSWSREWSNEDKESRPKSESKEEKTKRAKEERSKLLTKQCPKCQDVLSIDCFGFDYRRPDGCRTWCRKCQKQYFKENRDRYLPKKRESGRASDRDLRLEVLVKYSSDPPFCNCCGELALEFLSIDHIDGGGRKHKAEVKKIYRWIKKNSFPPGFRVLCHNCNQSLGAYGYCPHEKERNSNQAA